MFLNLLFFNDKYIIPTEAPTIPINRSVLEKTPVTGLIENFGTQPNASLNVTVIWPSESLYIVVVADVATGNVTPEILELASVVAVKV